MLFHVSSILSRLGLSSNEVDVFTRCSIACMRSSKEDRRAFGSVTFGGLCRFDELPLAAERPCLISKSYISLGDCWPRENPEYAGVGDPKSSLLLKAPL